MPFPACHDSWKGAAASYLDVGGQLLAQLQSEEGAVLTEQLLTEVAVAREALEKADAAYNKALDKLEVCSSALHISVAAQVASGHDSLVTMRTSAQIRAAGS